MLVQADVFLQHHRRHARYDSLVILSGEAFSLGASGEAFSQLRLNPRLGLVYTLDSGPRLRLAYQRWQRPASQSSLGPVATAGISLDDRLVMRGGELQRLRGQFEWELSKRSFATAFLDYKEIENQRFSLTPLTLGEIESLQKLRPRRMGQLGSDDLLEFFNTPEWDGGRIQSGGFSINHLLGEHWAAFGRYVGNHSENTGTVHAGNQVPYLPRHTFAAGASWTSPAGWYAIGRMVHRSSRYKDEANLSRLDAGWSGAADLFWQSSDKQWLFRLSVDNAFDRNNTTQYSAEANLKF